MTNEEAIKVIKELNYRCGICGLSQLVVCTDAKDIAIKSLNENTKLKAEIERLKSELERSVKLPCKVGQVVYEIKSKFTKCTEHDCERDDYSCQGCECLECDSKVIYFIHEITPGKIAFIIDFIAPRLGTEIFLTQSEAEQALAERKK